MTIQEMKEKGCPENLSVGQDYLRNPACYACPREYYENCGMLHLETYFKPELDRALKRRPQNSP